MQEPDRDESRDRNNRRDHRAILEQRPCHFGDGREHQPGGGGSDASQHAAQRRQVAVMRVERADRDDQNHRRTKEPRQRRERAERPAHARAKNHTEIDHVAAGQKGAQRKGLVELLGGEPSPPLHHDPPRPGQDAAKAR
jgi:hypothetical protein